MGLGSAWRVPEGFGWVWVPLGVAVDGTQTHPGRSRLDPKCDDRPSSSMWCPDGVGQGKLGLGVAEGSVKERVPPEKGEEGSLCRTPFGRKRSGPGVKWLLLLLLLLFAFF